MSDEVDISDVPVQELIVSLKAMEDPERAASIVEDPAAVENLLEERTPQWVDRAIEQVTFGLLDVDSDRRERIETIAGALRADRGFVRRHPERAVDVVVDRCRWYTDRAEHVCLFEEGDGAKAGETVEGLDELIGEWREYRDDRDGAAALERRRPPSDPVGGRHDAILRSGAPVKSAALEPGSRRLAVLGSDTLRVVGIGDGEVRTERTFEAVPTQVEWKIGLGLIVACRDEQNEQGIRLATVDPNDGSLDGEWRFDGTDQRKLTSIATGAKRVLLGGAQPPTLVDLNSGETTELEVGSVYCAALSEDGRAAAFGRREEADVVVVDVDSGERRRLDTPDEGYDGSPARLEFGPGRQLVVGTLGGSLRVWDVPQGDTDGEWGGTPAGVQPGAISFSADGDSFAVSWYSPDPALDGHTAAMFDTMVEDHVEMTRRIDGAVIVSRDVVFDRYSQYLRVLTAGADGAVRLWDLDRPRVGPSDAVSKDRARCAALDACNDRAAVVRRRDARDQPHELLVLDLESVEPRASLEIGELPERLAFTDEGSRLFADIEVDERGDDGFYTLGWEETGSGEWRELTDYERPDELDRPSNRLDRPVEVDAATGETRLPNPLDSEETLIWPEPLSLFESGPDVHLAEGCPYVIAAPRGRLEVLEVVGG
ncbi:MAG: WD40 repeat domain-containing protein [Bradymonadaceae bacterium]